VHPRYSLRTTVETWRRHGPWAACQVALEQLLNGLMYFERLHIIELQRPAANPAQAPAPEALPACGARGSGLDTLVADEPTLRRLQREGGWGIDDTKLALLHAGDTCLLSRIDGCIAGYTWVHTGGRPEIMPGLRLQLPAGALYNFAGFTHPDFRGAGLQSYRHQAVWAQPAWAHMGRMLGYVKATNFASRQGQGRSGYRRIGSVALVGSRKRFVAWLSPALRHSGVRRLEGPSGVVDRAWALLQRQAQGAWVGLVSHTLGPWLHSRLRRRSQRSDTHAYTCFHRAPTQLAALTGPVLDHLSSARVLGGTQGRPLRVLLYACSNGVEAYTWSAWLALRRPDLEVVIEASDLSPELVSQARQGRYTWSELTQGREVPAWLVAQTFDRDGDAYVVNERTRRRVNFSCADIVRDDLRGRYGEADVVVAQNVLFHLPPPLARRAFDNVVRTLAPTAALFIEGMDQDLRVSLTRAQELQPLAWRSREIYDESRRHIPARWWQFHYGAEPWLPFRLAPLRRYGTIFLKGPAPVSLRSQALVT
jgi:chemotaxis methyl-accepting protein methylase